MANLNDYTSEELGRAFKIGLAVLELEKNPHNSFLWKRHERGDTPAERFTNFTELSAIESRSLGDALVFKSQETP